MRGRATPIEVKRQQGTLNVTDARRKAEPEYRGDQNFEITLPPDSLSPDAQRLWITLVSQLASVGLNFPSHYEYLEAYCKLWEVRQAAEKDFIREGRYVMEGERVSIDEDGNETRSGGVKRISQSYRLWTDAIDRMTVIGAKLGLTAVDKTKISTLILGDNTTDKNKQKRIGVTG